ncbi:MAG: 3-deoxy-7-phosphoheptulonate synthase [Thermoplasmata archaeon]
MELIEDMRKRARELDVELVRLLAARLELTDSIGAEKKKAGMAVYDPETERRVLTGARETAVELGISPIMAETVIRTAMAESRLRQDSTGKRRAAADFDRANIAFTRYLPPPMDFKTAVPISDDAAATVNDCRNDIRNILDGNDECVLLVMGPCSIHDPAQAEEYGQRMRGLQEKVGEKFLLVMRGYVEKSRTGAGWTGYLTDPRLDGSGDVQEGITMTRKLLNRLGDMGVPVAVEFINPLSSCYIGDLVSWAAIGARSSGSQVHRDMASGLPVPVGFKNSPDGSVEGAIGAVESAARDHDYLGLDEAGNIAAFRTRGNSYCHPVLRGGKKPNYDENSIASTQKALADAGLRPKLMVDCSHGNSGKVAKNQVKVFNNVIGQIAAGNRDIVGLMLESFLEPGRQEPGPGMMHGISVTDECLGWDETEKIVIEAHRILCSIHSRCVFDES